MAQSSLNGDRASPEGAAYLKGWGSCAMLIMETQNYNFRLKAQCTVFLVCAKDRAGDDIESMIV